MKFTTAFRTLAFVAAFGLLAVSCNDDDTGIEFIDYSIKVNLPNDLKDVDPSGLKVVLTNTNTGTKTNLSTDGEGKISFTSLQGVFNIEVTGKKNQQTEEVLIGSAGQDSVVVRQRTVNLAGLRENALFTKNSTSQTIDVSIQIASKGWVIKELYTAGTKTLLNKSYLYDQFVEIYNNTDSVMYADGISIGETTTNTGNPNFYGNLIEETTYLQAVYTIEGNGTDWPVQPGKSIVISLNPIDHAESNSLNLAPPVSDFQWFDPAGASVDVAEVPNLIRYYLTSKTLWIVTSQMNRAFLIFKVPASEQPMADFVLKNTDIRSNNANNLTTSIGVPNEHILDGIELALRDKFNYKTISATIDIGFMYRQAANDGKSIRRRIDHIADDGRIVYKDTNNSTVDFWVGKTPQPKKYPTDDEKNN